MKRLLLLLSCIVISATSYCQITISKTAPKVEEKIIVPYDSTKNYLGKNNVESYEKSINMDYQLHCIIFTISLEYPI